MQKFIFFFLISYLVSYSVEINFCERFEESNRDTYIKIISNFEKINPDIKIKIKHLRLGEDQKTALDAAINGSSLDLFLLSSENMSFFKELSLIKKIKDIKYFDNTFFSRFSDKSLEYSYINNDLYSIPEKIGNFLLLFYNKKYMKKVPANFEDLCIFSENFKKENNDKKGVLFRLSEPYWDIGFIYGFGGEIVKNKKIHLSSKSTIKAFKYMQYLSQKYPSINDFDDYGEADLLFKTGKSAAIVNGDWAILSYQNALKEDLGIAVVPPISKNIDFKPFASTFSFYIASDLKKEKEKAVYKFIDYFTSNEIQKIISKKNKTFSTNKEVFSDKELSMDPYFKNNIDILNNSAVHPHISNIIPIWNSIDFYLPELLNGNLTPRKAAKLMEDKLK